MKSAFLVKPHFLKTQGDFSGKSARKKGRQPKSRLPQLASR